MLPLFYMARGKYKYRLNPGLILKFPAGFSGKLDITFCE